MTSPIYDTEGNRLSIGSIVVRMPRYDLKYAIIKRRGTLFLNPIEKGLHNFFYPITTLICDNGRLKSIKKVNHLNEVMV